VARDAQPAADQHHHDRRAGALGEVLGVTGERNAGVVDDAFLHRRGHHGLVFAGQTALHRPIEQAQDIAAVGGIEPARRARAGERQVLHLRRVPQDGTVAEDHDAGAESLASEHRAELGADSGRLAGSHGDRESYRSSRRSST
jgi:hypothetical protein